MENDLRGAWRLKIFVKRKTFFCGKRNKREKVNFVGEWRTQNMGYGKYGRNRIFNLTGIRERSKEKGLSSVKASGIFCLVSQRILW